MREEYLSRITGEAFVESMEKNLTTQGVDFLSAKELCGCMEIESKEGEGTGIIPDFPYREAA